MRMAHQPQSCAATKDFYSAYSESWRLYDSRFLSQLASYVSLGARSFRSCCDSGSFASTHATIANTNLTAASDWYLSDYMLVPQSSLLLTQIYLKMGVHLKYRYGHLATSMINKVSLFIPSIRIASHTPRCAFGMLLGPIQRDCEWTLTDMCYNYDMVCVTTYSATCAV
ncbi:hypothetical protein EI94DRAFT_956331 [Lactarius quietus]|nr:hypothetical protein EI94DRAFT_956331 [Lactarius quietus]